MFNLEEIVYQMVPTLEQPYPYVLLKTIDQLVQWSYKKEMMLKPKEEVARVRLCAHVAYERLSKKLSLPALSMEKLPLPIKRYQVLLERFRCELAPKLNRNISNNVEDDNRGLDLCIEMIHELCDKIKVQSQTKYFIRALKACYSRYSEAHYRKGLVAAVFMLVLLRLRGEQTVNRTEKKKVLLILGINDMKHSEWKRWNDLIRQDDAQYGWLDSVFQEKHNEPVETELTIETEPQSLAISGVGIMIHPHVDFYSDEHYSEYIKWKKSILAKILLKTKSQTSK
ncbi:hypothetical protein PORY_001388, partial [Pneumocystis oryctolagi]